MTSSTDPFNDDSPRIVLPTPGGRKPVLPEPAGQPAAARADEPAAFSVAEVMRGFRLEGRDVPVMVSDGAALLNLAHALRNRQSYPDVGALKRDTVNAVRAYESALGAAGFVPEQARAAHYVVCATLDDVIRNTAWGSDWAVEGLVSTFHHDVTGGDKVFELLAYFQKRPGANRDLLLLIYLCLSLGFEGRTRVSPRGALELAQIREDLYRTLRSQFGMFERDLSPHWKGEDARHQPLRPSRLFWLVAGLLVLVLLGLFVTFSTLLDRKAEATLAQMVSLPPGEAPSLLVPEPAPPPVVAAPPAPPAPTPPVPEPPKASPIESFVGFLQPEVEEGLVNLYRVNDAVLVRIANAGVFPSGAATINPDFIEIFDRIGQALAAEDFDVTILGHTDNQPIRSAPFPSNFHLSTARANAVRDILVPYIGPGRIDIRGEADLRPIADNSTEEGREANRRTEILVRGAGEAVPPALLMQGQQPGLPTGEEADQ